MANIKLILNEYVDKLGEVGEIVTVKPGYARNFLLPQGLAIIPTPGAIKQIEKKKEILKKKSDEEKGQAEETLTKLTNLGQITFEKDAGESGKLFGRITAKDVAEKINEELTTTIDRKQVLLKKSIGETGEFPVKIKLHNEITGELVVIVKPITK